MAFFLMMFTKKGRTNLMYEQHILPVNDIVPHDENQQCICGPEVEVNGSQILVIHHAADGRE